MNAIKDAWITGVGAATPLGNDYCSIAAGLLAGRSGVRRVTRFDASDHPSQIAGQLRNLSCPAGIDSEVYGHATPLEQVVLWCCAQALKDSGWWERRSEIRIGLVLGIGAEWLLSWEEDFFQGGRKVFQPQGEPEALIQRVQRWLGLHGPGMSVSAACASGNYALGQARRWLDLGWADVCLAGACDMAVTPVSLAGFGNLRALSRRNDAPESASRPFDRGRDGFVMGEGGAVFTLEHSSLARKRSARAYGRLAGWGASSDAHNMVIPSPDPTFAQHAMHQALDAAGVAPDQVDYVNAHATSTPIGDVSEAHVLQGIFGDQVRQVPVSSTKSMTGHLLTAAAAVEALACLVALERQAIPPTINLEDPDPECTLCHVPNQAREQSVRIAVSNSFGFGGSNTCVVLQSV